MVTKTSAPVELEIDANNARVMFLPLGTSERLRGKLDFNKIAGADAAAMGRTLGPIPGQVLGFC